MQIKKDQNITHIRAHTDIACSQRKPLELETKKMWVIILAPPFSVWHCASRFLVWAFLLLFCEMRALWEVVLGLRILLMFINQKKEEEEEEVKEEEKEKREKKTEVPFWHLEMNSRETMSFTEVGSLNLIKHTMQYWKQSDRVSADCWVTGSTGGPAGPEKTNCISSQHGTDCRSATSPV